MNQVCDDCSGEFLVNDSGLAIVDSNGNPLMRGDGIDVDCEREALRFRVRQDEPGFCHLNTRTCFGEARGLGELARRLERIASDPPAGSYTAKLLANPDLLARKVIEEAGELGDATDREHTIAEAADLLYFTLTRLAASGISLAEVAQALDRRARKVPRRSAAPREKSFHEANPATTTGTDQS